VSLHRAGRTKLFPLPYQKYTIGSDLRDTARRVLKLVVRANARRDKTAVLLEIREEVEQLKVLLRLALPRYARFARYSG